MVTIIKKIGEVFGEIYDLCFLVLISPLLVLIGLVFLKDEMVRGDGE